MSRVLQVAILYEDRLADQKIKSYGPHALVLACLADRLGCSPHAHDLKTRFNPLARKGVDKIIADCRRPIFGDHYLQVIAVCDSDRLHEHLGLGSGACKDAIRQALRSGCPFRERLVPVLLERNIETVVDAALTVLGEPPRDLKKKPTPLQRDLILNRMAFGAEPARRRELLVAVPSLAYLVRRLESYVR